MIISHYKRTPIAWAPDELSNCINRYTNHKSYINENINNSDIIQYHNRYMKYIDLLKLKINKTQLFKKPSFILYHSFPEVTDNYNRIIMLNGIAILIKKILKGNSSTVFADKKNYKYLKYIFPNRQKPIKQMVIAQYQSTLKEYKNYKTVRNIIDLNKELYNLYLPRTNKIKIGYSPSIIIESNRSNWETKGYNRTVKIIKKLVQTKNIECDIIINVPLNECLKRKSKCNIIIDECVTSSYHRSGLEGLALGKMTICSIGKEVEKVIKETCGCDNIPFENIWIDNLEKELIKIINLGGEYINNKGGENKKWMERYWNPIDIANEYINYYEEILNNE